MRSAAEPPAPRIAVPERLAPNMLDGFIPDAPVVDLSGPTMGTRWSVRLALPPGKETGPVRSAIEARLADIVIQMSHWEPGSHLSRYNAAPAGSWVPLPPDFATVIAGALEVAALSGGAFDPAIGRLTDLWGLGPNRPLSPPRDGDIAAARQKSGWRTIRLDRSSPPRLFQPGGVWLDLSGIAKGHAADAVADMLAAMGLRHALVEVGGECAGRGIRPDGEPWWVDMETPAGLNDALPPLRLALHQLAVATSGDYLAGAHTIDPATGCPALHATTAVTVLHARCIMADAWASALSVLRPQDAHAAAERQGLAARILSREGEEWLSPALQAML